MHKTIDTTYGGLPTPIFLPRYLGTDNILTAETQFPDGQKPTGTSGVPAKSSQTDSDKTEGGTKKKSLVGPIVGGVLGCVILFTVLGTSLGLFLRWKRHNAEFGGEGRKIEGTEGVNGVPLLAPYELGGKPRLAHELG